VIAILFSLQLISEGCKPIPPNEIDHRPAHDRLVSQVQENSGFFIKKGVQLIQEYVQEYVDEEALHKTQWIP
jgi:hypothetical protein